MGLAWPGKGKHSGASSPLVGICAAGIHGWVETHPYRPRPTWKQGLWKKQIPYGDDGKKGNGNDSAASVGPTLAGKTKARRGWGTRRLFLGGEDGVVRSGLWIEDEHAKGWALRDDGLGFAQGFGGF